MTKEIVTGERLGFKGLSQDLRDIFVGGLRHDEEGKFKKVLNSIAADNEKVLITDERGHFKPETNEEVFTQLISLTAKAALFEAGGGDTHSPEYYDLIKKTDVDLTRKLESFWADRKRQVEVSDNRVLAKAWGETTLEKGGEAVLDALLSKIDNWVNPSLVDNLVAGYDKGVSKMAVGTGVGATLLTTILAGCNPPAAEVQEVASQVQISGVVNREVLTALESDPQKKEVAAYVKNDMDGIVADFEGKFIPGTEMLYYISNGNKMSHWVFGAEELDNGQKGIKVLGYCDDKRSESGCQVVDKAFVTKEKDGAKVYGYVDEAGNSHGVIAYVGEDTYAFDFEGNSYTDKKENRQNLLDAIMSIGVTSVQAAAEGETAEATMEATATDEVDQKEQLVTAMVDDFLNSRGEFTDEKITENAMTLTVMDKDKGVLGLYGITSEPKGYIESQAVLLDAKLSGDKVNVLFGGVDQNNERMVYVMEFILRNTLVRVNKSKINVSTGEGVVEKSFYMKDATGIDKLLELYRGKSTVLFSCTAEAIPDFEGALANETDAELKEYLYKLIQMTKESNFQSKDLTNRLKQLNDDNDTAMPDNDDYAKYVLSINGFDYKEWKNFSDPAPFLFMFDVLESAENK